MIMLKNYLKVALRNIYHHKGYSLLIVLGMGLGIAVFILAALYMRFTCSYDTFHPDAERIHVVVQSLRSGNLGEQNSAVTPAPLRSAMLREFPEIEDSTRLARVGKTGVRSRERAFYETDVLFVDANFLSFFGFRMKSGSPYTVFGDPNTIVLSQDSALKYFGSENPIGRILTLDNAVDVTVTGIIENPPNNTVLHYGFLVPMETARSLYPWMEDWAAHSLTTFVRLRRDITVEQFEGKMPSFIGRQYPDSPDAPQKLFLLPLVDVLKKAESLGLVTQLNYDPKFSIAYFLIAMAAVLLLVVAINFMNLSTSRFGLRAREIGMRKVVGARRVQLINQFLGESMIVAVLSIPLALAFFYGLRQLFYTYIDSHVNLSLQAYPWLCLQLLGGILLLGVISGSYPSFFLSSIKPMQILKGHLQVGRKGISLRRFLVVSQFVLSILFIVFAFAIQRQVGFMAEMDQGFSYTDVLTVTIPSEAQGSLPPLKDELSRHPDIFRVATAFSRPINWATEGQVIPEGWDEQEAWTMKTYGVDLGFIELMELTIIQGRSFSREYDDTASFILNETAVRQLEWENPLGKTLRLGDREGPVIGVAEDYLFDNAHFMIEPSVLFLEENTPGYLHIKTGRVPAASTVDFVERTWRSLNPETPFVYSTLENRFESAYRYIGQMSAVFGVLGALAVFISCLGLLAMAFYSVTRRTREIGIRKVLGASVPTITRMLIFGFLRQVVIANLIAWPITYVLLTRFLRWAWAYRTDIPLTSFAAAAVLTLVTAVCSVAYQTIRLSLTDPAEALRYE
jgi:putative ABC transport system permease protein